MFVIHWSLQIEHLHLGYMRTFEPKKLVALGYLIGCGDHNSGKVFSMVGPM